jgi:membrane-associated phospholipid phosphatase
VASLIPRRLGPTSIAADTPTAVGWTAATFVGAVVFPLGLFAALAAAVTRRGAIHWDTEVLRFAEKQYESSIVNSLNVVLLGSLGLAVAIAAAAVIVLLTGRKTRFALFWAVAVGGVLALDVPLKDSFRRPELGGSGGGYSFPSGNAMASMAILVSVALTSSPRWRRWVIIVGAPVVVAYGAALVYAWWHYPSDVLAGWCIALAWTTGAWFVVLRHSPRRRYSPHPP